MADFSALDELLRRAQLAKKLSSISGQGASLAAGASQGMTPVNNPVNNPVQQTQQAGVVPPQGPVQGPVQAPTASSDYQEALKEPPPSLADYHPSLMRRIFGITLGGLAGLHDPKTGYTVGRGITMGPYDTKMSEYQKRLAQKKEAFEAEMASGKEAATEAELTERRGAERARAGAEEARRKVEEFKISDKGLEHELEVAGVRHPTRPKTPAMYKVHLNNGEDIIAIENEQGQLVDPETETVLGRDSYSGKEVFKLGTQPKPTAEKEPNEYRDFREGYLKKHPNATGDELASAWETEKARHVKPEHMPQALMIDPSGLAQLVRPGSKVAPGSTTAAGLSSENVPTAPTRQMAETAPKVIDLVKRTRELVNQQEKTLGPASSRWADFMAGKVGSPNPEFTRLRTNAILLRSLLLRMHMGARGGQQMMNHFRELLDVSIQSPENMRAALDEIEAYANDVSKGGKKEPEALPGGISLDEINAEIERRKKK